MHDRSRKHLHDVITATRLHLPVSELGMRAFTVVIERCADTGQFVGYVLGFPGAHSQGESLDELHQNLAEVIGMLLEDGEP